MNYEKAWKNIKRKIEHELGLVTIVQEIEFSGSTLTGMRNVFEWMEREEMHYGTE